VPGNAEVTAKIFVPTGKVMMVGFPTLRVACLDCGYIGNCLSKTHRAKLEEKVRGN